MFNRVLSEYASGIYGLQKTSLKLAYKQVSIKE